MTTKSKQERKENTYLKLTNDGDYVSYCRGYNNALFDVLSYIKYGDYTKLELINILSKIRKY